MNLINSIKKYKAIDCIHLKEIAVYYQKLSLKDAIIQAALGKSQNKKGKVNIDSHQRRIGSLTLNAALKEILKEDKRNPISNCTTFEEIFEITEKVRMNTFKLGNLWSYDTALRIGFNKRLYPKEVYIQAGVLIGAKKVLNRGIGIKRSLPLSVFKKELQVLEPYEAENFLCIWGKENRKISC